MDPTLEGIVGEVSRLVAEEAHLIGQELQDSLNKDQSRRLHDLTTMLDQIDDRLTRLRPAGGHRVGTD